MILIYVVIIAEEQLITEEQEKPEPEKPAEEKPIPKKKIVKKARKDDDFDDYINQLINQEIPKTELEEFEKPEFDEPLKKPKKRTSLVPQITEKPKLVVEELPEEVVTVQVPTESGEVVERTVTKRKIKKKQGDQEQIIEIKTVEEEGKEPETEVIIEEAKPSEDIKPVGEIEEMKPVEEQPVEEQSIEEEQPESTIEQSQPKPKPKKKKAVKKPVKDDDDEYIRQLLEAEIPKTELEVFEKPEFDEPIKKPKKKKSLIPKPSTEDESIIESVVENQPEETVQVQLPKKQIIDEDVIDEVTVVAPTEKEEEEVEVITEKILKTKRKPKEKDVAAKIELQQQPEITDDTKEIETVEMIEPVVESPVEEISQPEFVVEDEEAPVTEITPIPDEIVEEKLTDADKPDEEQPEKVEKDRKMSVSKTKKKIKKKKTSDLDEEYLQQLMEQEIPKTELEKFEKIEFEKPQKKAPEKEEQVPIKIERKEQEPTEVVIVPVEEVPKKLKPKKPKQIEQPTVEQKPQIPLLKSRILYVDVEKPLIMKITEIGAVREHGELSRNIEEADEVLKTKIKKFKPKKQRKNSLERPELEVYEKYVSSDEESSKKDKYQRMKKETPEEPTDTKTLKLGNICS